MKLNNKQKVIAVAMFFLVLIGGVSTMNYLKFSARTKLLAQMTRFQREEKQAQDKIKKIPNLLEERADLIATIDKYAEILPPEQDVQHDAFVDIIDSYRRDTKILIQKAEYIRSKEKSRKKGKKAQEPFVRHRYRFSLLGTVPDFVEFVNKIENHTRFLKVDAFKVKPYVARDDGGGGPGSQNDPDAKELRAASNKIKEIELTISTYTYKGAKGESE